MLEDFDLNVLEDLEFQEDSVREEIISPVLKYLGYKPSGNPKVVRSRKLSHPFVNIGSKTNKINIIPDYILEVDGNPLVVLDAKSPQTSLENSKHVEQVYSYTIHPEVRAKIYALCNGKEWIIWDVDKFEPIVKIQTKDLIENISVIERYLHPKSVKFPERRDFFPDYGLRLKKMGFREELVIILIANEIGNIMKVEDDLYTIIGSQEFGDDTFAISFDLNKKLYLELLELFPKQTQNYIFNCLSRQPYRAEEFEPILVTISGYLGSLTKGVYEDFVPVIVTEIKKVNINSY